MKANSIERTTSTKNCHSDKEIDEAEERATAVTPIDWKPQKNCYFCVDGKLITVNDRGELVPESGPVPAEPQNNVRNVSIKFLSHFNVVSSESNECALYSSIQKIYVKKFPNAEESHSDSSSDSELVNIPPARKPAINSLANTNKQVSELLKALPLAQQNMTSLETMAQLATLTALNNQINNYPGNDNFFELKIELIVILAFID